MALPIFAVTFFAASNCVFGSGTLNISGQRIAPSAIDMSPWTRYIEPPIMNMPPSGSLPRVVLAQNGGLLPSQKDIWKRAETATDGSSLMTIGGWDSNPAGGASVRFPHPLR